MYIRLTFLYTLDKLEPSDNKGSKWCYGGAGVYPTPAVTHYNSRVEACWVNFFTHIFTHEVF